MKTRIAHLNLTGLKINVSVHHQFAHIDARAGELDKTGVNKKLCSAVLQPPAFGDVEIYHGRDRQLNSAQWREEITETPNVARVEAA